MRLILLAILVPALSLACSTAADSESQTSDDATEALTSSQKAALENAVENDVHDHARRHIVTALEEALGDLTDNEAGREKTQKAIDRAMKDGFGAPYYGTVRAVGHNYLWADVETDEGEGPAKTGTTYVFSATGKRVMSRDWIGSHQY
jgi:hypothetical protein